MVKFLAVSGTEHLFTLSNPCLPASALGPSQLGVLRLPCHRVPATHLGLCTLHVVPTLHGMVTSPHPVSASLTLSQLCAWDSQPGQDRG